MKTDPELLPNGALMAISKKGEGGGDIHIYVHVW